MIDRDDTIGLVDLLHNVPPGEDLDFLLHTPGGDIDAAEKLVLMIRQKVGTATLRVIVPDFAKSAGTLIALGADAIVMSDTSELGPIDPQVIRSDGDGNRMAHSVLSYLEAFEHHAEVLKQDPGNIASQIMLSKLDPGTLKQFEAIRTRAQRAAEDLLKHGMFRDGHGNWTLAAAELMNVKSRPSHGQMISWQDAVSPKLGLAVEHMDRGRPALAGLLAALLPAAARHQRPPEDIRVRVRLSHHRRRGGLSRQGPPRRKYPGAVGRPVCTSGEANMITVPAFVISPGAPSVAANGPSASWPRSRATCIGEVTAERARSAPATVSWAGRDPARAPGQDQ